MGKFLLTAFSIEITLQVVLKDYVTFGTCFHIYSQEHCILIGQRLTQKLCHI